MACAVIEQDFFSLEICPNSWLAEADEVQPAIDLDAAEYTPEAFAADAKASLRFESVEHVDALLAFAFATPAQCYDLVARTVAGFISKDLQHEDYRSMFHAAARVALEMSHPLLFQEWLAGNDAGEIPALVGAELSKLRPSQLVFREFPCYAARRLTNRPAHFPRFDA